MAAESVARQTCGASVLADRPRGRQPLGDVEFHASLTTLDGTAFVANHACAHDAEAASGKSLEDPLVGGRGRGVGVDGAKLGQVHTCQCLGPSDVEPTEHVALGVSSRSEQRGKHRDQSGKRHGDRLVAPGPFVKPSIHRIRLRRVGTLAA